MATAIVIYLILQSTLTHVNGWLGIFLQLLSKKGVPKRKESFFFLLCLLTDSFICCVLITNTSYTQLISRVSFDMTKDVDGIVYRQEQFYKTCLHYKGNDKNSTFIFFY